jgi:hypothetical protein
VKWSGIQNTLEESLSDVLILLDCCASGVCTTDEGNGVTELIAACAYNAIANGVGPFSFTHALISRLRMLAPLPYFTIGFLYIALFTEIQSWRVEDSRFKKAPIHLVLSQNNDRPRSIRLSSQLMKRDYRGTFSGSQDLLDESFGSLCLNTTPNCSSATSSDEPNSLSDESFPQSQASIGKRPLGLSSLSPRSSPEIPEYPRLLFSIRIEEDVKSDLSIEMFTDWLRDVPVSSSLVRVEAGFASDSTLLMVSMPAAMLAYLPSDPAITMVGSIRSKNLLALPGSDEQLRLQSIIGREATAEAQGQDPSIATEGTTIPHINIRSAKSDVPVLPQLSGSLANRSGRLSVSTIGTTSSGVAQSAYTKSDETFSDGRASIMTGISSVSTSSQYTFSIHSFRPPKHDPINGVWNDVLRVIPCKTDHSSWLWDNEFHSCAICGFSRWHSLMLHAKSMDVGAFMTAMEGFRKTVVPLDFAGNSSSHYLMSAGFSLDYLRRLHWMEGPREDVYGQNVFGQNPLHALNPNGTGQELITLLEWFNKVPAARFPAGLLLCQRDIYGRTPLHTLLCHPLSKDLYPKIFNVYPLIEHQLRTFDISGRSIVHMMNHAAARIRQISEEDCNKLENGIIEVELFLDRASPGSKKTEQMYGFHEIARGARGTTWAAFFECRICNRVNAHSNSYLDQMNCACACGRDRGAPDDIGLTPAHALITCKRAAADGSPENPVQTAELFELLIPIEDTSLREVLHVLDPEGNSLMHNVAVRGFHEILEYMLLLERPERRRAMVNACVKRHLGEEVSVLAAVEEELQKVLERLRIGNSLFASRDPGRALFLIETKSRLHKVKEVLLNAGAEMKPNVTTRWRIT